LLLLVLALFGLCGLAFASASAAEVLAPEVAQALQRERVPLDAVSVLVQEAGSGTTRLTLNAQKPVNPASLAKLVTTYAALDQLGPAFSWKTPVWVVGRITPGAQGGMLEGNVHIQGRGDPKLTLERLWLLVQRLRQMGFAEIRGDIVLDQSAFAVPEGSTAEFDNEPLRPYNARAQALLLNLNAVLYTFTPDPARGRDRGGRAGPAGPAGRCQRAARHRAVQRLARGPEGHARRYRAHALCRRLPARLR
jgi:D-alanyl-D-alanine carboxypeptidase/D-alanyl-D-alanine-endopeptidase (penicillin-binding protein 4)